jgi:hypothetical protein
MYYHIGVAINDKIIITIINHFLINYSHTHQKMNQPIICEDIYANLSRLFNSFT